MFFFVVFLPLLGRGLLINPAGRYNGGDGGAPRHVFIVFKVGVEKKEKLHCQCQGTIFVHSWWQLSPDCGEKCPFASRVYLAAIFGWAITKPITPQESIYRAAILSLSRVINRETDKQTNKQTWNYFNKCGAIGFAMAQPKILKYSGGRLTRQRNSVM